MNKEIRKEVIRLAIPVIIQNTLQMLMFFVDTVMVGKLGAGALATLGIASPVFWSISMVAFSICVGTVATVARSVGEKDVQKTKANIATSLVVALILGVVLSVCGYFFLSDAFAKIYAGENRELLSSAAKYMRIIFAPFFFTLLSMTVCNIMRASGDTLTPMFISGFTNLLNIFGNYILIYGKFGFPEYGVLGAAISTSFCKSIEFFIYIFILSTKKSAVRFRFLDIILINKNSISRLMKVTIPAIIEPLVIHSGILLYMKAVAALGEESLAAHRTAIAVESLSFMPGIGFQAACATLVGQYLGAKKIKHAEVSFAESAKLAVGLMTILGILFLAIPQYIALLFTNKKALIDLIAVCLRIGAIEQPFMALTFTLQGALRGAGDTKSTVWVAICGVWLIRVPLSFLSTFVLGFGLAGIWIVTVIDWFVRAVVFKLFYSYGKWKRIEL